MCVLLRNVQEQVHCSHVNNDNAGAKHVFNDNTGANHEAPNDYTNRDHDPCSDDEELHNTSASASRVHCEDGCGASPDQTRLQRH